MNVQQILDLVDSGDIALPEFQRGYVWNREQVRGLFSSLYRGYPIGAFMTWNTKADGAAARGGPVAVDGTVKLLLDGQQRVTTLYGVMRGKAPKFFEGSTSTFSGMHFNLDDESFEFYAPGKMKGNAAWISVTDLMIQGIGPFITRAQQLSEQGSTSLAEYINRLNRITQISKIEVHIEEVTGVDKTLDVVVDIFNRVNSGGTKLSKGDLALARICASWPEARHQMNEALDGWSKAGYSFRLEWLLRNVNAEVTGEALFSALADVETTNVKAGLTQTIKRISHLLDIVAGRLGLDHDRVLFGRYAFPVMTRYLHHHNGKMPSAAERDKLLYWYIHAGMWGRFAGSTETVLNQDLAAVDGGGIDALIDNMRQMRGGDLTVRPADFSGYSLGARFYPVLYLLTRTLGAQDFGSGVPLSAHMLGHLTGLQVHHIFPKAKLYAAGYKQGDVNAVANFCFLTQNTNLTISAADPARYLAEIEERNPGALASQWVPSDPSLWRIDRYMEFLEARRELLAAAANGFLDSLLSGKAAHAATKDVGAPGSVVIAPASEPRIAEVDELIGWLTDQGYATPEVGVEVTDPVTGKALAVAEAFWPAGLQEGMGSPVVLELDPEQADEEGLSALGYHVFMTSQGLRDYVDRLGQDEVSP
ncbi:DUF262 domain-containing protein [Modestobacter sp. VKM Ac-2983]|uniref:GmrSD restriction endonuclease domain-containing protein n=1 Tax=Modestobacter sp. VKM Ac-2983 TaxID=3004137 RepID=UPI0022ABAE76|nr:DUF262 domain-containing protein [Modestobacter sp. VKM Ac-2983]MCZ2804836.1 DUF262 domain-containing protein [Modestobacter sp. VKM Ac-2983]